MSNYKLNTLLSNKSDAVCPQNDEKKIVALLPDSGDRFSSIPLYV